jgi:choline-sulfatase
VTEPAVPAAGDAYDHPMSVGMRRGFMADAIARDEMMRARAAYFACVSYLDEIVGDLLVRLEAAGLLDNTVIVYTTDHGEMAGEHGVWWKNGWYEGCTRVPLIVSTPAQRQGRQPARECATPVGLVDLFPTLCALAGVETPDDLDGVDLSGALNGGSGPPDRPVFCDNLIPRWGGGTEFRSIRWRRFKYVHFRACEPLFFDLATDPGEQCNLLRRGIPDGAAEAHEYLRRLAAESMDFEAAEHERTVRDGALHETYAQDLPAASNGNLYLMPSGRLVDADAVLYNPCVLAEHPGDAFGDCTAPTVKTMAPKH